MNPRRQLCFTVGLGIFSAAFGLVACAGRPADSLPPPLVTTFEPASAAADDVQRAQADLEAGRNGLAIDRLTRALAQNPGSARILTLLGAAYDGIGRHDLAREYFSRVLTATPGSSQALYNLGYSFYLASDYQTAQHYFRQALAGAEGRFAETIRGRLLLANARATALAAARAPAAEVAVQAPSTQVVRVADRAYELRTVPPETVVAMAPPDLGQAETRPDLRRVPLEVSNGAGVRKLAARVANYLGSNGARPRFVTNADHFGYARTVIIYRSGYEAAAAAIAKALPVDAELVASNEDWPVVRLILGRDILSFDQMLVAALKDSGNVDLLS